MTDLVANFFCENFTGELAFWNEDGGSSVGENFGVGGLVIFGGVGIRNEDAGDAEVGEFCQTGGSTTSDGKIGCGVDFFHTVVERSDPSGDVGLGIAGSQSVFVITATEVNDLQSFFVEVRKRLEDGAVDSLGALASAHHEESWDIRLEAKSGAGEFWGEALKERAAEWGASEKRFSFGEKAGAFCKAEEDFGDESAIEPIGFSGDGVGFMDESGDFSGASSEDGCGGSEASHTEDGIGDKLAVEGFHLLEARAKFEEKLEEAER